MYDPVLDDLADLADFADQFRAIFERLQWERQVFAIYIESNAAEPFDAAAVTYYLPQDHRLH